MSDDKNLELGDALAELQRRGEELYDDIHDKLAPQLKRSGCDYVAELLRLNDVPDAEEMAERVPAYIFVDGCLQNVRDDSRHPLDAVISYYRVLGEYGIASILATEVAEQQWGWGSSSMSYTEYGIMLMRLQGALRVAFSALADLALLGASARICVQK